MVGCPRTTPPANGPATPVDPADTADEPPGEAVLGPSDVIEIRVYREDDLTGEYEVEADGTINFPLVGSVSVAGLTPTEASAALAAALEDGYLRDANVTVRVLEYNSRQVTVYGEVNQPGTFPYTDGMTVVQAIALAGGLTEAHAANRTTLTRTLDGEDQVVQVPFGDISQGKAPNVPLMPEDIVFVPKSPI